jgi:hypothetical protein
LLLVPFTTFNWLLLLIFTGSMYFYREE